MRLFFPLSGDDVFISYSRKDGALYAAGLADELTGKKLSCFIDKLGTEPNHDLPPSLRKKIRSCTVFVLVGTKGAAQSEFVKREIVEFKQTGRTILPVDFDGSVGQAVWYNEIPGLAVEAEKNAEALETGDPSPNVVGFIEKSFNYTRRNQYMFRMFWGALSLFFMLIGLGIGSYLFAMNQANAAKQEADKQAQRAAEQTELANNAERRAIEQEEIARDKERQANEATKKATDAEKLADEKTKLADAKTKLANDAAKRADQQTKKAELAENRRQEAETRQKDAETKAVEARNRAEIAAEQEQGSRVVDISRQPGREFEAVKMIVPVAESNFRRSQPDAQVINGLVTSVMATDYALPFNIERNNIGFVQLSPDGNLLFVESGNSDSTRKWEVFNLKEDAPPLVLGKVPPNATGVSFSRNNRRIAVTTDLFVKHWDLRTKTELPDLGNYGNLSAAAFDDAGENVAYPETESQIIVENLTSQNKKTYSLDETLNIKEMAFYPNGDLLVNAVRKSTGGAIQSEFWVCARAGNACAAKGFSSPNVQKLAGIGEDGAIITMSLLRGVTGILAGSQDTIYRIDDASGRVIQNFAGYKGEIKTVSLDNRQRVVLRQDDALRIADARSSPNFYALRGHDKDISTVVFSTDGEFIATAASYKSAFNKRINVWNAKTGELLRVLESLENPQVIAFSKDNRKLAAYGRGRDRAVKIWNLSDGKYVDSACDAQGNTLLNNAAAIAFLRDGRFVATAHYASYGGEGGRLVIWNAADCAPVKAMALPADNDYDIQQYQLVEPVNVAVFSPDGETLVAEEKAEGMYTGKSVTKIKKWDLTKIEIPSAKTAAQPNEIFRDRAVLPPESLDENPPGKLKAVNFSGGLRLLFETPNRSAQITTNDGSPPFTLDDGFEKITEANFSADGQYVIAVNEAKQELKIWNALKPQPILAISNPFFSFDKAVVAPNGENFAVVGKDGVVRIYPTTPEGFFKIASDYMAVLSK